VRCERRRATHPGEALVVGARRQRQTEATEDRTAKTAGELCIWTLRLMLRDGTHHARATIFRRVHYQRQWHWSCQIVRAHATN
jgi:hypothetical protein